MRRAFDPCGLLVLFLSGWLGEYQDSININSPREKEPVPIDNNGAERSLRGVAVGRRNWTYFGSDNGGRTAAVLGSLIATAKRHLPLEVRNRRHDE